MAKDKQKKPTPTPKTKKAVLDQDGVLVRYEPHDYPEGIDVEVECDLALDRYRYDAKAGCFVPLAKAKTEFSGEIAHELRLLLKELSGAGLFTPSDRMAKWLKEGK